MEQETSVENIDAESIHANGMEALCFGMIKIAVSDLKKCKVESSDYINALRWVAYDGDNNFYVPFERVCEVLEVEPSYVRKLIYEVHSIKIKLSQQGVLEKLLNRNARD